MDPNKLNSDPDPEFWPNLDPDPDFFLLFNLENNVKNSLIQKFLNLKTIFVKNYKRIMVRQKIANKLVFMTNNKS